MTDNQNMSRDAQEMRTSTATRLMGYAYGFMSVANGDE